MDFPVLCPDQNAARRVAVDAYHAAINDHWHALPTIDDVRVHLAGHDLACWCPIEDAAGNPVPCHADILLALSNCWDHP